MSPLLVTGATGNVGRPLVQALADAKVAVRAASRHPRAATSSLAQPVRFDFTDPSTFEAAFAGVETMFLVRPPDLTNPRRDLFPALDHAAAAGLQHVVFLSVQGADRLPILPHARIERWLRGSGLSWTILRASFFDQNLVTVHGNTVRDRSELVMPAGNGRTAFVDANDVAAVAAQAMLHPDRHRNRVWTLTGSEALSYGEVAGIMTVVLGRQIHYTQPGLTSYVFDALRRQQMPTGLVAVTSVVYTTARLGLAAGLTDHVQQILGRPPTTMAAFIERQHAAFDQEPPSERRNRAGRGPGAC